MPGTAPLPQWCPSGHTPMQKTCLQRLRTQKIEEGNAEKEREAIFNAIKPMQSPKREWRPKKNVVTEGLTPSDDEMDLHDSPLIKDGTPPPESMDVNMVHLLPSEFEAVDESMAQLCLGPKNAIFEKPDDSTRHLKPLYIKGHIDGSPIPRTLVDGGAAVNLMPYSLFKKLGKKDEELMKTHLTLNGVGGNVMEAKGVMTVELTVGTKTIATAFFIVEVQGNYSVILGRDWIHACRCIPSTLHQFLIQWVGDEVEIVPADTLA